MSITLWNRFGSSQEIANSEMGNNLSEMGSPSYTDGKFTGTMNVDSFSKGAQGSGVINANAGCVEVYIQPQWNSGAPGTRHPIFDGNINARFLLYYYDVTKTWRFGHSSVTNSNCSSVSFSAGEWHHIAMCWDKSGIDGSGDYMRVYWDNVLIGTVTLSISAVTTNGVLWVGRWQTGVSYSADTYFDNLKIHDYAKTNFSDSINIEGFGGQKRRIS